MFDVFSDKKLINELAKENPSLLEKIVAAIKDFIAELKKMIKSLPWDEARALENDIETLDSIRVMAETALWQIENNKTAETEGTVKTATSENIETEENVKKIKNTVSEDGVVKMSLVGKTQEGIEVYETSKKNKKLSYVEKLAIFKQSFYEPKSPNFIGKKIGFIKNEKQYYAEIDRFAVNENINKINPKNLNQWDKAKINLGAEGDFVNLVENARYDRTSTNHNRNKNDAHKKTESFDYFYKTVFVDRVPFEVIVNIRNEQNLNKFLYEVKLKKIKDSQLELQLEKFYSQRRSKVNNTRLSESFIVSISQDDTPVNTEYAQNGKDNTTKFCLAKSVERTKELIAVHNMTVEELQKSLNLGVLPMPSIAVIKAERGHSEYGDVSIVFPKEVIDPAMSSENKIYGGDVWSPVYPTIQFKVNEKVQEKISNLYDEIYQKYRRDRKKLKKCEILKTRHKT